MDELLARRLVRQLRIINLFLIFFSLIFLIALIAGGIAIYKIYTYAHNLEQKTTQTLNLQQKLCSNGSVSSLLSSSNTICK